VSLASVAARTLLFRLSSSQNRLKPCKLTSLLALWKLPPCHPDRYSGVEGFWRIMACIAEVRLGPISRCQRQCIIRPLWTRH